MKHWRGLQAEFVGCRFEASLLANAPKLYAMGFRSPVKRSTLADANESCDWHIGSDLAALLIRRERKLCASELLGVFVDFARPYTLHQAGAFHVPLAGRASVC